MADILEVKRRLADRTLAVAEYLLPAGRKEGAEWRCGSTGGEAGKSLGVHLSGEKAGVWSDFTTGESGDLLDLWCATKGVKLADALDAARDWLGMERPKPYREPKREYTRPPKPEGARKPRGRVLDYLCEDRNIPGEVLERYRVAEEGDNIIFPFLLPDGTLALAKRRKAADGEKPVPTASDCEPVLFGWQAVSESSRAIVITEGEIDALSGAAYGWPCVSVPFGGGKGDKQRWIESEYERLERFERIYIATDMDKPGEEAAEEIANRLGRHRCLRVRLPRKDFNECLVDGVSKDEIAACFGSAEGLDPEGLKLPSAYLGEVLHLFWPADGEHVGYQMPYSKAGTKLLFRPAELTLWSGDSGAGKSQILSDCIVDWVRQGSRICLVSLEMKGGQTLKRMVKQVVGADRPPAQAIEVALAWLDKGLLLYDRIGKADVDSLLSVFDYARAKYGCNQFVIDSLMRLGIAGDDYTGQEKVIFRLVEWAIGSNVHLHLVAHSRKGVRDRGVPETEDIKGAMEIGANAFNILTVWRNRKLEEDMKNAADEETRAELNQQPGVLLNVAKQRNGDFEGRVALWFDQASYRYRDTPERAWGRNYLDDVRAAA